MAASTSHICAGETPALRSRSRFAIWAVCAIVVVAAAAYKVWSSRIVAHPMCVAQAVPESPRLVAGAWHWIERAGAQVHLVRVLGGKRTVIASHEDIVGYSASPTSVAWAARDGAKWQVQSGSPDGTGRRTVWESPNKLFAAWTDGTKTAWVVDRPMPRTAAGHIAPLGRRAGVWMGEAGPPRRVADLAEGVATAQIAGMHQGALIVAVMREDGIRCSAIYRIAPDAPPRRIAGEVGAVNLLLATDGTLYWTAPSRASNSLLTGCIRAADPAKPHPRTVADWLPVGGILNETSRGMILTGAGSESAWRIRLDRGIGSPIPMLPTQWPVGAGERDLIAVLRVKRPGHVTVSRIGIR